MIVRGDERSTAVELRADFVLRAHELPVAGTWR